MAYPIDFAEAERMLAEELGDAYFSLSVERTRAGGRCIETRWRLYVEKRDFVVDHAVSLADLWAHWEVVQGRVNDIATDIGSPDELATEAAGETVLETTPPADLFCPGCGSNKFTSFEPDGSVFVVECECACQFEADRETTSAEA